MDVDFVMKRGSTRRVMVVTLEDANGVVDLTGWQVFLTLRMANKIAAVDRAQMTIDADQVANKGKVRYKFTSVTAELEKGVYNCEFKVIDPNGDADFFPTLSAKPYKRVLVQDNLQTLK